MTDNGSYERIGDLGKLPSDEEILRSARGL